MPDTFQRVDCLAMVGWINNHRSLRILPDGQLGLCKDARNRKGRHRHLTVLASEEPTRRRAVQLALQATGSASALPQALLKAINARLGDTPLESLDLTAAYFAAG